MSHRYHRNHRNILSHGFHGKTRMNYMLKTKTKKTPLMTTETYGLTFCSSRHVLKSKLLHCLEAQNGFVPKPQSS